MNNEIGSKLKQLRVNKLMSLVDLSKQINLNKNSISLLERGCTHPKWVTLQKYKRFFGKDFDEAKIK